MQNVADQLGRTYAHFHRVLAELLLELSAEADPYWLGEPGHDIRGDHQASTYRPAIYRLNDAKSCLATLRELSSVQADVLALTGRTRPGKNLLPPLLVQDVRHIRIGRHGGQTGRTITREQALTRLEQLAESQRNSLREFEYHATPVDERRRKLAGEVTRLKRGIRRLEVSRVTHLRETYRQDVIRPYIYYLDGSSSQLHMRNTGLIAIGPAVSIEEGSAVRRIRRDRVVLEPLISAGSFEFYDLDDWQAARSQDGP